MQPGPCAPGIHQLWVKRNGFAVVARRRLGVLQSLVDLAPGQVEGALAVCRQHQRLVVVLKCPARLLH